MIIHTNPNGTISRLPTITGNGIYGFFGEYRFLSNFHVAPIFIKTDGLTYLTSEHAYMSQKTFDEQEKSMFSVESGLTPVGAKRLGSSENITLRDDWNSVRVAKMLLVVREKFKQHADIKELLLNTGNLYLEETNNWRDNFWGCDRRNGDLSGQNQLGKILMQIRDELRRNMY